MNENDIKIGMLVNYHSMIGGPVTKERCVIESEPWQLGSGEWIVSISGISGGVSLDALTVVEPDSEIITELILTTEQQKAINSLERAFKKCINAKIYFHNCYGTLYAYDKNIVKEVTDTISHLRCYAGYQVESKYNLDSWADDNHYVHLHTLRR